MVNGAWRLRDRTVVSCDEVRERAAASGINYGDRQITARDGNMLVVYNKHVAMQYRNHIAHFMEGLKKSSQKK